MARKSIDVILNAWDNTGPATASASANLNAYVNEVASAGDTAASSLASDFASVIAPIGAATLAVGALAAAGYLVYKNWETIGPFLANVGRGIADSFTSAGKWVIDTLNKLLGGTVSWGQATEWAKNIIFGALATIEFAWKNLGLVVDFALTGASLAIVTFANRIHYEFTVRIPAWATWLANNIGDIMKQILENLRQVLLNATINVANAMLALRNIIEGKEWKFTWKPLTDGLSVSLKNLPQIAAREVGGLEQYLQEKFAALGLKVGLGLTTNITKRLNDLPQFKADIKNWFANLFSGASGILGGGGIGRQTQATQLAEGESSRFLSGAAAASQEQLMREQLELQRLQAEAAIATRENSAAMRQIMSGDILGALRTLATSKAAKVVING